MNKIVGNNLKKMRNASSFSQEEISSALGITRSAYSNYESADREMPLKVLEKASNLFGCELYAFFEEDAMSDDVILASAFRFDDLCNSDLQEIIKFQDIVKSYIKMDRLAVAK